MKLAWHILNNLINNATGKDISLAIHLAQFADDDGLVCGVHYKKVARAIGFSVSGFYKSLYNLEALGVVDIDWHSADYGWWSFRFVDNDFTIHNRGEKDFNKNEQQKFSQPYLNCNYKILHTEKFHKSSKSEKVIILNLIRRMGYFFGRGSDYKGKKTIPLRLETLINWTGKTRRSVMRILERLQENFDNFVNFALDGNNVFVMRQSDENNKHTKTNFNLHERRVLKERDIKIFHAVGFVLDKLKVTTELDDEHQQETLTNICNTIKLYNVKSFNEIVNYIATTLKDSGYLSMKYFHSLLRQQKANSEKINSRVLV
ncbi:MAG: hypothetical protein FWB98_08670 [Defluviitaleaceae bacterium]|nr:hypothetical protein [Defluviitaleaceae bacterium]